MIRYLLMTLLIEKELLLLLLLIGPCRINCSMHYWSYRSRNRKTYKAKSKGHPLTKIRFYVSLSRTFSFNRIGLLSITVQTCIHVNAVNLFKHLQNLSFLRQSNDWGSLFIFLVCKSLRMLQVSTKELVTELRTTTFMEIAKTCCTSTHFFV